ncbi:hypothetical protein GGI20_005557 [Coemansia sp. BCRC 34301]|nr:hypothetical protein GGI20_005557 [Coemansia sp. BCRC 34301]
MAQNVYLAMQSGALFLTSVTSRPSIVLVPVSDAQQPAAADANQALASGGQTLLFLGTHALAHEVGQPKSASAGMADYLFSSGDCLDHAIIQVTNGAGMDTLTGETMPAQYARSVLANQSPMIDFALAPSMAYWTSGRVQGGAIHCAQFGHAVHTEELIETRDNPSDVKVATCQMWHFAIPCLSPCFVLQRPQGTIAVAKDSATGEWQVCQELQQVVTGRRVVFVGSVAEWVLCISSDSVEVWPMEALLGKLCATKPLRLATAQSVEIFTHGVVATSLRSGSSWVVLGVESMVDEPEVSSGKARQHRQSSVRVIAVPNRGDASDNEYLRTDMRFEHEISCVRSFTLGNSVYVAVGTYEPRLYVLRLDAELAPTGINLPLPAPLGAGEADRTRVDCSESASAPCRASQVINDICILCNSVASCVLVGLRDGTLLQLALDGSLAAHTAAQERLSIANVTRDVVGIIPIQFASANADEYSETDGVRRVMIVAGSLLIANLKSTGQVDITACFGSSHLLDSIRFMVPTVNEAGDGTNTRWYYAVDNASSAITLLSVDLAAQCHINELAVCCEPRRVICDTETGMLVVAGVLPRSPSTPFPTSCLTVVDPRDARIHSESRLRPGELVHALEAWHIHGPRLYRYICVGTGMYPANADSQSGTTTRAKSGRLTIYSIKAVKRKLRPRTPTSPLLDTTAPIQSGTTPGYELKYVWESEREDPVLALAHLGDKYLVVAVGSSCLVLKLDVVQKRLIECCEIPLRFLATSLHVRERDIVVGSQREGVHVLRFTPASSCSYDALHMLHSARYGVCTADACFLSSDLVLGVSDGGYIYAMGIPSRSSEFALDYIMGTHLGSECTRVKQGSPVRRLRWPEHAQAWSANSTSSDGSCVLVNTVDGALWTLLSISDDAFMLLRQLERAMVSMGPSHAAYPLLTVGGSITRARYESKLPEVGTVDGALSTAFVEGLTQAEQAQVVQSSPELQQLALQLLTNNGGSSSSSWQTQCPGGAPDGTRIAAESIAQLIRGLNSACVC